ncbi:MAG TPA: cytochrome c biogenesis protein ResB [Thermodesulfovibrionales bacterium]|nr:cytochrome c biogenesis protein ResB [Thermodesulfovibrionales bacterium]
MEKKKETIIDKIWNFLASVKLAVIIFAVLSLTSIVGTVIEQNAEPAKNIKVLTKLFGQSATPTTYRILDSLGFMDMYHSWWFVTILLLFAANLVICSVDRLPKIMKVVKDPIKPLSEDHFKGFGIKKEFVLKMKPEKAKEAVSEALKKKAGFNLAEVSEAHGFQLYAQKGNFTRLGVYITHFSILIILAGALIGIFFGFKGYLNLPEGVVSTVAYTRNDQERPIGFGIRCDKFQVDFYGNSDMPKAYKSLLTVIENGKEVMKKEIVVNDPLKYKGVTFYQSSYGLLQEDMQKSVFMFRVTSRDGRTSNLDLRFGDTFSIPGMGLTGKIEDFSPALGLDERTGRPFTYAEQMNNPAVLVSFSEGGNRKFSGWIFKRHPETWRLPDGNTVEFSDIWGIQYTGLQVRNDPGVWVVYFGCVAMAVGLFIAFFMSHKRLWVRLVEEKNGTRVVIGASANKNRQAFERQIDKVADLLTRAKERGR